MSITKIVQSFFLNDQFEEFFNKIKDGLPVWNGDAKMVDEMVMKIFQFIEVEDTKEDSFSAELIMWLKQQSLSYHQKSFDNLLNMNLDSSSKGHTAC